MDEVMFGVSLQQQEVIYSLSALICLQSMKGHESSGVQRSRCYN